MQPQARHDDVMTRELDGELVIYDHQHGRAHALNRTAALVWQHCDGETDVDNLATLLAAELRLPADPAIVWSALGELDRARLLRDRLPAPERASAMTRRELLKRGAVAGGLATLLPVVHSLTAPTAAMAQSETCPGIAGFQRGDCTTLGKGCCSKIDASGNHVCFNTTDSGCCTGAGGTFSSGHNCTPPG